MCGVTAFQGENAASIALAMTLCQLSRGTDGAGVAYIENGEIRVVKAPTHPVQFGVCNRFFADVQATTAISHNRMPSRGSVKLENTHPFMDCKGKFALVHNGTIVGTDSLREQLKAKGHSINGETDSEVYCHLICDLLNEGKTMLEALRVIVEEHELATLLILTREGEVWGLRGDMPLELATLRDDDTGAQAIAVASEENSIKRGVPNFDGYTVAFQEVKYGDIFMCRGGRVELLEHHPQPSIHRNVTAPLYYNDGYDSWLFSESDDDYDEGGRGGGKLRRYLQKTFNFDYTASREKTIQYINRLRHERELPTLTVKQTRHILSGCSQRDDECPANCTGVDGNGELFSCFVEAETQPTHSPHVKTTLLNGCADFKKRPDCPLTFCDHTKPCFRQKGCAARSADCPPLGACLSTRRCFVPFPTVKEFEGGE